MKNFQLLLLLLITLQAFSQGKVKNSEYDKWSVELNVGQNKALRPFSVGYYSSNPNNYFNFSDVNHFDIGARYMFTTKFGFKLDFASDEIKNQSGNESLNFETQQYRIGLQGVVNLARVFQFETFTSRFGLLGHAGVQVSQLTPKTGLNKDKTEDNGGIILGLTPQFRVTNWLAITGDFSVLSNVRQHFNWDGSYSEGSNNLTGTMYNTSLGLTFYLGKKEKHADWYVEQPKKEVVAAPVVKPFVDTDGDGIADKEDKCPTVKGPQNLNGCPDFDGDGVIDILDKCSTVPGPKENNGCPLDTDGDGVTDKDDKCPTVKGPASNNGCPEEVVSVETMKKLNDYAKTILFDSGKATFQQRTYPVLVAITGILKDYPNSNFSIEGHTDSDGLDATNQLLSENRAAAVKNYLITNGISSSRLSSSGFGESMPIDTNKTKEGKANNRRVEVKLVK